MTLDKAIEILLDLDTTLPQSDPEDRRDAVKLGIEALKRLQTLRRTAVSIAFYLLPGETKD